MRQDLPPQIDRHHLKALRDLMLTRGLVDEEGQGTRKNGSAEDDGTRGPRRDNRPVGVQQSDVCQSVRMQFRSHGHRYDPQKLEKDIARTICGLQILFRHRERDIPFIERGEENTTVTSGWCSVALIGEVRRAARRQVKRRRTGGRQDPTEQLVVPSAQVIEWLWSILAKRVATRIMAAWRWPRISKGELLDRLQQALLWRLTRVPTQGSGRGLHGGDLLHALELYVGEGVRMKDAEEALSELFADWRQWLQFSDQILDEQGQNQNEQVGTISPGLSGSSYKPSGLGNPGRVCNTADDRFIRAGCGWIDQTLQVARENICDAQWPTRLQNSRRFLWELQRRLNHRLVRRQNEWERGKSRVFGKTPRGGGRATDR